MSQHFSARSVRRQRQIARHAEKVAANHFFNLLTSPQLLAQVEALLPGAPILRHMSTEGTADDDERPVVDPLALRVALSRFPTGVCVVTTLAPDGQAIGLTVNSFASVPLEPPLVQWNLRRSSPSLQAFRAARGFAINVLAADQHELSSRFARPIADKFAGVRLASKDGEDPLIERAAAHFSCAS